MPLVEGVTADDLYALLEGLGADVKLTQKTRPSLEKLGAMYLSLLDTKLMMLAASEKRKYSYAWKS
jgi:hypothetical protein